MQLRYPSANRLAQIAVQLVRNFFRDQGVVNAAALTYTTLFAIVPLMTVSYAMLAAIPSFQGVGVQVESWIFEHFIPATGSQVQSYLAGFAAQARSLTVVGLFFLFVTALLMMKNIEAAFNRIWHIDTGRRGLSSFLIYWAVLTLGPLLIGAGIALSSYLIGLAQLDRLDELAGVQLLSLVPWMMTTAAFTLIYAVVPNCSVPWRAAFAAGICAALLFEFAKRAFAFFVSSFPSYELIYGAFAAVPLFLVWIYICWSIILLGAMLTRILAGEGTENNHVQRLAPMLQILERLHRAQLRGETVAPTELQEQLPDWPVANYIERLQDLKLVAQDAEGYWLVKRDLATVTLSDLVTLFPSLAWVEGEGDAPWQRYLAEQAERVAVQEAEVMGMSLKELFAINKPNRVESIVREAR